MEKITASHPLSQSADIISQNIDSLKTLFPTIVKEGKIDMEELKALLGEEVETSDEYCRFTWAGKSQARQEANKPSTGTLRPAKEESKDWNTTQNIFIEGDNLEALKLLQKSYSNKVKMIYIDPPYNTGKDFVYKDNYADNLGNYLSITGQADEAGKKLSTNAETDGLYHSNWLNMMYPRLKLARNLLKDDGVIFISIDDNEVQNLKKLGDEVFGEENFITDVIWQRTFAPKNDAKFFSTEHEHLLVFSKSIEIFSINPLKRGEKQNERYGNPDNDVRGPWISTDLLRMEHRENSVYEIVSPNGKIWKPIPGTSWRHPQNEIDDLIKNGEIMFGSDGNAKPRRKRFLKDVKQGVVPQTIWKHSEVGHTQSAKQNLNKLFDNLSLFDYPKPVEYLLRMISISTLVNSSDIILDFFAGSGSTAHAVMQHNAEDTGNRKFICVQLPESTTPESEAFKAGYKNIAEITKERLRRAGEKVKSSIKEDLFNQGGKALDIGFRVFKLDSSNINAWDGNVQNFENTLLSAAENIKPDRNEEDVLYEILLKSGLDLVQPIEEKIIAGKKVFNIGMGALFICLAIDITTAVAEGIGKWKQELDPATCRVIFKDTGFTDVEKTNSIQILKRFGITEVNTI